MRESVESLKKYFSEENNIPPMLKVVEAVAARKWFLRCEAHTSLFSLVLSTKDGYCTIWYTHGGTHGTLALPAPAEMVKDTYRIEWKRHDRNGVDTGLFFLQVMERLDDFFSDGGNKYFKGRGDKPLSVAHPPDSSRE